LGQAGERFYCNFWLAGWAGSAWSLYMRAIWPAASFVDGLVKEQPQGKCGDWEYWEDGLSSRSISSFACGNAILLLQFCGSCSAFRSPNEQPGHIFAAHFGIIKAFSYAIFFSPCLFVSFFLARTAQNFD